jgi:hypothetical protein
MTKLDKIRAKMRLNQSDKEILVNWVGSKNIAWTYAATLTFAHQPRDYIAAEETYRKFAQNLHNVYFRRKKHERIIRVFATLEGMTKDNAHIHCAIERPQHVSHFHFTDMISKHWCHVNRNNETHTLIKDYIDSGWDNYITKEFTLKNSSAFITYSNF